MAWIKSWRSSAWAIFSGMAALSSTTTPQPQPTSRKGSSEPRFRVALRLQFRATEAFVGHPLTWLLRLATPMMFLAGLLALLSIGACRQGVPVFDPGARPIGEGAMGTPSA